MYVVGLRLRTRDRQASLRQVHVAGDRAGDVRGFIKSVEQRVDKLAEHIDHSTQLLMQELARHTKANYEAMQTLISTIDDKYADLPKRVSRLEVTVFPGEQR